MELRATERAGNERDTPIVYGLRGYGQLTPANADQFHTEADCPMRTREAQPKRSRASR